MVAWLLQIHVPCNRKIHSSCTLFWFQHLYCSRSNFKIVLYINGLLIPHGSARLNSQFPINTWKNPNPKHQSYLLNSEFTHDKVSHISDLVGSYCNVTILFHFILIFRPVGLRFNLQKEKHKKVSWIVISLLWSMVTGWLSNLRRCADKIYPIWLCSRSPMQLLLSHVLVK